MSTVIVVVSCILLITSAILLGVFYKIGKDETRHRPCGGGRRNA